MKPNVFSSAMILVLHLGLVPAALAQEAGTQPRLITVYGTAEVKVAPDEAILTLGVDTHDRDISVAEAQNADRVKKLLVLAEKAGIESKDIQTSSLSMGPSYSDEKVPRLLGYDVAETITMRLRDLAKYEGLMVSLLQAGLNRVNGVEFVITEPRKYRDEARSKAIRAAREKAAAMASELGQSIGKPWKIEEQEEHYPSAMQASINYARVVPSTDAGESALASGQVLIRASVRVSFQLE
jgi:uncharacterized protein YggE